MMISAADSFMPSAQQLGIIAVLLAAVVVSFVYARRRRPVDGTPRQYRRELDSATTQGRAVQRDMEQLLAELEKLAGRINEQLDARHEALRQSLVEADQRISALRILLDEAKRRLDQGPSQTAPAQKAEAFPAAEDKAFHAPDGEVPHVIADEADRAAADETGRMAPRPADKVEPPAPPRDDRPAPDRRRRIYQLADEGLTPMQIALQLGQPVGEVELILNLRCTVGEKGNG